MPDCLFKRNVLENFSSVEEVGSHIEKGNLRLCAHHLTLLDKVSIKAIYFFVVLQLSLRMNFAHLSRI